MSRPTMDELATAMMEKPNRRRVTPFAPLAMKGEEGDDEPPREKDPRPINGSPKDMAQWEKREANRRRLEKMAAEAKALRDAMLNNPIGK